MKTKNLLILFITVFSLVLYIPVSSMAANTGEQVEQGAENAGQQMKESGEKVYEKTQEAQEEVQQNMNQAGQQLDQTGEQMKQGVASQNPANQTEAESIVEGATLVLRDIEQTPDQKIPAAELKNAEALIVIPNVVKAGLIVGGRYGDGVLLTHDKNQDQWSPPVFVSVTGGSLGAQAGVTSSDLIMIFKNKSNVQDILNGNDFTLGADASVAAGSAGAKAKASTEDAEVLTYKRTEGLFAGASVTGSVISLQSDPLFAYYNIEPGAEGTRAYFGNPEQLAQDIAGTGKQPQVIQNVPESAKQLQDVLKKYTSGDSSQQ